VVGCDGGNHYRGPRPGGLECRGVVEYRSSVAQRANDHSKELLRRRWGDQGSGGHGYDDHVLDSQAMRIPERSVKYNGRSRRDPASGIAGENIVPASAEARPGGAVNHRESRAGIAQIALARSRLVRSSLKDLPKAARCILSNRR